MTMTIIYTILAFIIGILIGRLGSKAPKSIGKSKPEMAEMRIEAHEAVVARTNKRKAKILALAEKQGKITNDDVEDMFCISDSTSRHYLNELESEGKLKQIGDTGRGVYYEPI